MKITVYGFKWYDNNKNKTFYPGVKRTLEWITRTQGADVIRGHGGNRRRVRIGYVTAHTIRAERPATHRSGNGEPVGRQRGADKRAALPSQRHDNYAMTTTP